MSNTTNPAIVITVLGRPVAQPRQSQRVITPLGGSAFAHNYVPGKHPVHVWRELIAFYARDTRPAAPLEGPLVLSVTFHMSRPKSHRRSKGDLKPTAPWWVAHKPDFDNLVKPVCDVLKNLGYYRDDAQIAVGLVAKNYSNRVEHAVIKLAPLPPEPADATINFTTKK